MSNSDKIIYVLFIPELNISKIGISRNAEKRVKQLQTGCSYKIQLLKQIKTNYPSRIEKILHRQFASKKIDQEEYNLMGEWFNIEVSTLLDMDNICKQIEGTISYLKNNGNPFL